MYNYKYIFLCINIFLHYHTKVVEKNDYICISTVELNISNVKKIYRILQKRYILDKIFIKSSNPEKYVSWFTKILNVTYDCM